MSNISSALPIGPVLPAMLLLSEYLDDPISFGNHSTQAAGVLIIVVIIVDVNDKVHHLFLTRILMVLPVNQTPICAMMNILRAPLIFCSLHHYVANAVHHHSRRLNNRNMAFSTLPSIKDQTLLSNVNNFALLTDFH